MKFIKTALFIIASVVMGCIIYFFPNITNVVSVTYVSCLGVYLALDISGMIKTTSKLDAGCYDKLNTYKYIISEICLLALFILCMIKKDSVNLDVAMESFGSAIIFVIGIVIAGIEGNKIATGEKA